MTATSNAIEVYEGNSLEVTCVVTGLTADELDDFDALFTVYNSADVEQFEKTGSISGLSITFDVLNMDNQLAAGNYVYEITISNTSSSGPLDYTLRKDTYHVKKSNKYPPA